MSDGFWNKRIPVIDEEPEEAEGAAASSEDAEEAEESELSILQQELVEARDRSARTLADFENYRKRVDRDRKEERRYGAMKLAVEVVGVVDNLERALEAGGSVDDLKAGVEMTLRQMQEALERHDVRRVPAVGKPFDPNVHEAVSQHEDPSVAGPTVSAELQSGYTLHERLVRPAVVTVAVPPKSAEADGEEEATP